MGKPTGFLEIERKDRSYVPPADRIRHYDEFFINLDDGPINLILLSSNIFAKFEFSDKKPYPG